MDITTLVTELKTQASNTGTISLDATILSAPETTLIQNAFGLQPKQYLQINHVQATDITQTDNSVTISAGTVDVLNLQALAVKSVTITVGSQTDFILVIAMPNTWALKDSFSNLPDFPFSFLAVSESYFIYSTQPVSKYPLWSNQPADAIDLIHGLSFGAHLSVGALSVLELLLDALMPGEPLKLSGSFEASNSFPYPVMSLNADLNIPSFEVLPGLTIEGLQLAVQTTKPGSDSVQDVIIGVSATTMDLQFLLGITGNATAISISGKPLPTYSATLDNLGASTLGAALLPAGTTFSSFLPAPISDAFESIEFTGFSVSVSLAPTRKVTYLAFSIGEKPGSSIKLGLFDLTGFTLNAAWIDPGSAGSTMIGLTAQAMIPMKSFPDPFDFSILITKTADWAINSIEANYKGTITLAAIIEDIAHGTTLPEELSELTFSDFLVQADPSGNSFSCSCQGAFDCTILSQPFTSSFWLTFKKSGTDYTFELKAGFNISETGFLLDAVLAKSAGSTNFQFTATADEIPLSDLIANLFASFDVDLSVLPEIVLSSVTMNYNTPTDNLVEIDASFIFDTSFTGDLIFVAQKKGMPASWEFVAVAGLGTQDPLDIGSKLPLIGKEIAGDFELKESLLVITSKGAAGITLSQKPNLSITPGVSFAFDLVLGGLPESVMLPVVSYDQSAGVKTMTAPANPQQTAATGDPQASQQLRGAPSQPAPAKTPGTISIQKKIGPVFIESIGITYENKVLACSLNASMAIGPMGVSMNGFSFGSSLTAFKPSFNLHGLGFGYATTGLTIEGAIVRIPDKQLAADVTFQFDGALVVQAEAWGLSALASYAQMTSGLPSFFIFVDVNATLGGPAFFIVEGLMGGFGYNRSLVIPAFDKVQDFPLLAIGGPASGSAQDQAMHTIQVLEGQQPGADGTTTQWIVPKEGDYWIALGLKFSSFEIVKGELLLVAEFGKDLQFALLGLAWLSLPQGAAPSDTFVYVELQMEAVLKPTEGYFNVAGSLTRNSFVLTKDCHLTGGFAFNLWFGNNPNAGQFVMTVGGYHPAFQAPSFYPNVARLGFNWQVSSEISIKGGSYFAITPSCGMAGGSLEVLYQSGDIKAWFTAQADMLVTWNPFSFVADLSIEIGASVRSNLLVCHKTVSVSLGASLALWGPPLGGTVRVHIVIVTVTIGFGSDSALDRNKQPLDWPAFKALLPAPEDVCKVAVNSGLTQTLVRDLTTGKIIFPNQTQPSGPSSKLWVVRAGTFSFTTQGVIPASQLTYGKIVNGGPTTDYGKSKNGSAIEIRPMNLTGILSVHRLWLSKSTADSTPIDVTSWTMLPSQGSVAATLWGSPLKDDEGVFVQGPSVPSADTIPGLLTGYTVQAPDPVPGSSFGVVAMTVLMEEFILDGKAQNPLSTQASTSSGYQPVSSNTSIADIAAIATTALANRNALYAVLNANQIYTGSNSSMQGMAANAGDLFTDEPMEVS